jgi:MoaA/NifB/PqqE/SkfB family radical SAM enzyme
VARRHILALLLLSLTPLAPARKKARLLRAYLAGRPIWCSWQVTYVCNFRCSFCDYWKEEVNYSVEARAREATLDDFRIGAAKLGELGSLMISMAGGEPLMRRDLAEITATTAEWHFPFITTNGWLVNEQRARELWDAGLWGASVSLDFAGQSAGCDRHDENRGVRGAADRARHAVQVLSRTRTRRYQRVNVMCVLSGRNIQDIEPLIRFAAENDASFMVQPFAEFKHGKVEPPAVGDVSAYLLALKRRYRNFASSRAFLAGFNQFYRGHGIPGCKAGQAFFNIDTHLNVQKCVEFREQSIGNLRDLSTPGMIERLQLEHRRNACRACWYNCRGEIEVRYTPEGLLKAVPTLLR